MPAAKKSAPRRAVSGAADRARALADARTIDKISKALASAQKDFSSLGSNLGAGAKGLRTGVAKSLRESSRDLGKMRTSLQKELERLQKELTSSTRGTAAKRGTAKKRTTAKRATAAKRGTAAKTAAAKRTTAKRATTAKRTTAKRAPAKRTTARRAGSSR